MLISHTYIVGLANGGVSARDNLGILINTTLYLWSAGMQGRLLYG